MINTIWVENTNSMQQPSGLEKQENNCSHNQERYNTQEIKYKYNHPGGSSVALIEKGNIIACSIYLPPTHQVTEEDVEQLPAPMILLGDLNQL